MSRAAAGRGKAENVHFAANAHGSLAERGTGLDLLPRLGHASPDDTLGPLDQAAKVGGQLTDLRNDLAAQTRT